MMPSLPPRITARRVPAILLLIALAMILPGCPAGTQADESLRREVDSLKKEVAALKEQLNKLEQVQKELLARIQEEPPPPAAPAPSSPTPASPEVAAPPPSPEPLSVTELLKEKDRYLGTRVTVKGPVGPVLVHHKSLMLTAPGGMVEVLLGKLPDQHMVDKLLAAPIAGPATVTGLARLSPRGGTQIQIQAEELKF